MTLLQSLYVWQPRADSETTYAYETGYASGYSANALLAAPVFHITYMDVVETVLSVTKLGILSGSTYIIYQSNAGVGRDPKGVAEWVWKGCEGRWQKNNEKHSGHRYHVSPGG